MSINHLPLEVLDIILRHLDGWSFTKAKEVCKSWYSVTKKLQKDRRLWQRFCDEEIPEGVIEDILSFKSFPYENLVINWADVYKRWFRGQAISEQNFSLKSIQAFCANPVTCMKISGSWVFTGHSDGYLMMWNQISGKLLQRVPCHLTTVTDMAMVDLLNLGSYYGLEDIPFSHHHIITVSKDTCIKIMGLLVEIGSSDFDVVLNKHGGAINAVRVFGKQFAVSSQDNTVTLWNLAAKKEPCFHLEVSLQQTIIGPRDNLDKIGFWYSKIYCISHMGNLKVHDLRTDEWLELPYLKNCLQNNTLRLKPISAKAYYAFRDQIILILTACGKMIVSLGEKQIMTYYLMEELQTSIVSLALHGTILALGGENGRLYLYQVPDKRSLLDLELSSPDFYVTLSEASIIAIDIAFDYYSPIVIASTTESVFVMNWKRKEKLRRTARISKLML